MAYQISTLQTIYQSLQSYTLPAQYTNNATDNTNSISTSTSTNSTLNEYKEAREQFLRHRIQSLFTEYIATYDGTDSNFLPDAPTSMGEKLDIESEELVNRISRASGVATEKLQQLLSTYECVRERREELGAFLEDAKIKEEQHKRKDDESDIKDDAIVDDDEDDDDDGKEFMTLHHNEKLTNLTHRRLELEAKLKRMENDIEITKAETQEKKQKLKEMINPKLDFKLNEDNAILLEILNNEDDYSKNSSPRSLEEYETSLKSLRDVASKFQQKAEQIHTMTHFYDQIRTFASESSGVNLIYIQESQSNNQNQTDKDQYLSSNSTPSKKKEENLILHLQLFAAYDLQITLSPVEMKRTASASKRKSIGGMDKLIISNAKITNATEITDTLHGKVSCPIEIDELIMLSRNLPKHNEQIRFLVREICSRIQSTESRVNDLALLRTKYLTKVVSDQADEVICTLNEGLTIILHVLLHCPVVSVFIHEILGVGGWDRSVLENMKETVNSKNYIGSVAVIDALVKEIEKVDSEKKARSSPCNFRINKKS